MGVPNKDVAASELFAKLCELPRPSEVVDFPRQTEDGSPIGQVRLMILTQAEQQAASAAAEKFVRKLLGDSNPQNSKGYLDLYNNECAVQLLYRACKDPNNVNLPTFPNPEAVRDRLSGDEIGVLVGHYLRTQDKFGPIISTMSQAEIDAWITKLEQGALDSFFLDLCSPGQVWELLTSLVQRISSLRTDIGSLTSQVEKYKQNMG